ncbi:hypothetical protein PQX77_002453 [Marasmius sp. AFHP31]|nr:hypothetical protein PQX77_002453 [Marasmius sp. AFHP31]
MHLEDVYQLSYMVGSGSIISPSNSSPSTSATPSSETKTTENKRNKGKGGKGKPGTQVQVSHDLFLDLPTDHPFTPPPILAWKDMNLAINKSHPDIDVPHASLTGTGNSDCTKAEFQRRVKLYDRLMIYCLQLQELIWAIYHVGDAHFYGWLGKRLKNFASTVKSTDTTNLRKEILEYLPLRPKDRLQPLLTSFHPFSTRGINHPSIAALFAPREEHKFIVKGRKSKRWQESVERIQQKETKLLATDFPWFLYDGYDPKDRMKGLFRGHVIIHAGRHILTSPSLALTGKSFSRSNATLLNIRTIMGFIIAYVCLQVCFWFYYFIIKIISGKYLMNKEYLDSIRKTIQESEDEYEEDELKQHILDLLQVQIRVQQKIHVAWQEELLEFWNEEIFGSKEGRGCPPDVDAAATTKKALNKAHLTLMNRESSPLVSNSDSDSDSDSEDLGSRKRKKSSKNNDEEPPAPKRAHPNGVNDEAPAAAEEQLSPTGEEQLPSTTD